MSVEFSSAESADTKTVDALALLASGALNEAGYRNLLGRLVRDYLTAAGQVADYHDRLYALSDLHVDLLEQAKRVGEARVKHAAVQP
jgi:hypothetical protein